MIAAAPPTIGAFLSNQSAAPPQNSTPKGGGGAAFSAEAHIAPAGDPELPSFARQGGRKPLWRPPIVSCFLIATTGLLALHYLAG